MEPPKSGAGRWNHQNQAPRDGTTEIRRLEMEPLKSRAKAHRAGTAKNQGIKSGNRQKSRHPETEPPKSGTQIRFRNPQNQAPGSGPARIRHPDQEPPKSGTQIRNCQHQAPVAETSKSGTRIRNRQNQAPGSGTQQSSRNRQKGACSTTLLKFFVPKQILMEGIKSILHIYPIDI